ncbi:hypothetical protein C0993_011153 [Termitomyces sp. T159_Od127]|nr:hypothetical protein C0993_011153 [Termitomyces sp. T159_Od127]
MNEAKRYSWDTQLKCTATKSSQHPWLEKPIEISISPQHDISMPPKEPTRHQLSSRLAYSQHTPAFLQKLKNRIAGAPDTDDQFDEEFEDDGSGRPPIPKRPSIPTRPDDDPGSADEDDVDEKPQVVVLKKGKHLTAHEAENVRREEKGLLHLPGPGAPKEDSAGVASHITANKDAKDNKTHSTSLSFSSSKGTSKPSVNKRKILDDTEDKLGVSSRKKSKKPSKTLLSFGDDA